METLNATKAELALIKSYLNQSEARDKICRAIQYGSKFISAGERGVAQEVDRTTSLARKVFRLMKVRPHHLTVHCLYSLDLCASKNLCICTYTDYIVCAWDIQIQGTVL